jgi:uncharacterized membrane protein YebE (DUF533 family)
MALVAKNVAMNGGGKAAKAAKHVVQNKSVKTAIDKQADAVVVEVAGAVTAGGVAALARPFANRKNRRLAVQLARQIGGTYARAIIAGDRYWVVWQDDTPSRSSRRCLRTQDAWPSAAS